MASLNEFIAELESTFSIYAESGDLDRISIKTWVISCLNEMGKNICEKGEAVIPISNSQGKLPDTFKSLILALNLEPLGYKVFGDREKAEDSFIYRQRILQPAYFDDVTNEYVPNCNTKIITEKIVMNDQPTEIYYKPELLSVVKGFKKESFEVDCLNIHPSLREAHYHQISINKRTIQTNFKNGAIYVQFNSLPTDDEDEIVIPQFTTNSLYLYIENYCKLKIAEDLIIKNKNPQGLMQLIPLWKGDEVKLRNAAKSECNYNGLSKGWHKQFKRKLEIQENQYNLPKR